MTRYFRWTLQSLAPAAVILVLLAGCDGKLGTYPVKGRVTFPDGQPLKGGTIETQSILAEANGLNARGAIQADGTFELSTYDEGDGAIAGEHKVIIAPPPYWETDNPDNPTPVLHERFNRYETSGLVITVQPGENNIPIAVERPGNPR